MCVLLLIPGTILYDSNNVTIMVNLNSLKRQNFNCLKLIGKSWFYYFWIMSIYSLDINNAHLLYKYFVRLSVGQGTEDKNKYNNGNFNFSVAIQDRGLIFFVLFSTLISIFL